MEFLERVLDERAGDLARTLADRVGFTHDEASRFLRAAGPALIESYEWQADEIGAHELVSETTARDLLAGIGGRTLATRLGLSQERTWAGLRALVPAVLDASGPVIDVSAVRARAADRSRSVSENVMRFEIGFGLAFDREGKVQRAEPSEDDENPPPADGSHPIFGWLLSALD